MTVRRNAIVYCRHDYARGPVLYGRVSRVFDDGRVEVIDCGRNVTVLYRQDVIVCSYKGYINRDSLNHPRFIRMTGLRKLKQLASRYTDTIWKRKRNGEVFSEHTRFLDIYVEEKS